MGVPALEAYCPTRRLLRPSHLSESNPIVPASLAAHVDTG